MRRFIIGAVAAAAVFASAAAPAQAHHDGVCTPPGPAGLPPVCLEGHLHLADAPKEALWNAFVPEYQRIVGVIDAGYTALNVIPEPLCVETACISNLRGFAHRAYSIPAGIAHAALYQAVCTALGRPECPVPTP